MKEVITLTLASNGVLMEMSHDSTVYQGGIEQHQRMLQEIASYLQGYYSSEYRTKQIRISTEEANLDYIGENERI